MVKSMFAAVAGLNAHQNKMDVISNNIANCNTWGYKTQTASFMDSVYNILTQPSGAITTEGGYGGSNASQVGYGSSLSTVSTDFSTSYPSYTGRSLDIMCQGTGFFMVGPHTTSAAPSEMYLSRVGQFYVKNGYLVDGNGYYAYGFPVTEYGGTGTAVGQALKWSGDFKPGGHTPTEAVPLKFPDKYTATMVSEASLIDETISWTGFSIDSTGKITGTTQDNKTFELGYLPVVNVDNPNGMIHGEGYYYKMDSTDGEGAAGNATIVQAGMGAGSLLSNYLEGSNVNLATEFSTMITTQRGFSANTKMITVTDEMLQELVNMKR